MVGCIISFLFGGVFGVGIMCIMNISSANSRIEESMMKNEISHEEGVHMNNDESWDFYFSGGKVKK